MKRKGITCLLCQYFYFEQAEGCMSEQTGGTDMEIGCRKEYWHLNQFSDTEETYRIKMMSAEMCNEFKDYREMG